MKKILACMLFVFAFLPEVMAYEAVPAQKENYFDNVGKAVDPNNIFTADTIKTEASFNLIGIAFANGEFRLLKPQEIVLSTNKTESFSCNIIGYQWDKKADLGVSDKDSHYMNADKIKFTINAKLREEKTTSPTSKYNYFPIELTTTDGIGEEYNSCTKESGIFYYGFTGTNDTSIDTPTKAVIHNVFSQKKDRPVAFTKFTKNLFFLRYNFLCAGKQFYLDENFKKIDKDDSMVFQLELFFTLNYIKFSDGSVWKMDPDPAEKEFLKKSEYSK